MEQHQHINILPFFSQDPRVMQFDFTVIYALMIFFISHLLIYCATVSLFSLHLHSIPSLSLLGSEPWDGDPVDCYGFQLGLENSSTIASDFSFS